MSFVRIWLESYGSLLKKTEGYLYLCFRLVKILDYET